MTLEEARRQYEVHERANGHSEKTIDWKNTAIRRYATFAEEKLGITPDVSCLTRGNVELYIVYL